jgi:type II secretory pathway pseudopilin PulG
MRILVVVVALAAGVSTSAIAQSSVYQGFQQGQAQQFEIQRLQLCNQAMQAYLRGGPAPPAMCDAPAARVAPRAYVPPQVPSPMHCETHSYYRINGVPQYTTDCY